MLTYIMFTTLTLPKRASVEGVANLRMLGASSDSVRLAFITSGAPSGDITVVMLVSLKPKTIW